MTGEQALLWGLAGTLLLTIIAAIRWRRHLSQARAALDHARSEGGALEASHVDRKALAEGGRTRRSLTVDLEAEGAGPTHQGAPLTPLIVDDRAEVAHQRAEVLLEATLDALQSAVALLDADGVVVAANRSWRHGFHGHLAGQGNHRVGQEHLATLEGLEAQGALPFTGLATAMRQVLDGEADERVLEHAFPHEEGTRWVEVRVTPFDHARETGVVVRYEDITDRRTVEQERRRASEQFEVAVGNLARSVGGAADAEEVAERLVDAALRVSEAPVAAAMGSQGLMAIRGQDEEQRERLREALHLRPSDLVWVSASLPDAQTPLDLVLLPDGEPLTQGERNKIEILATQAALALQRAEVLHRVRAAYDRLDSSLMQKQVFLDVLSHDLKNPLAVVRGRLELMSLKHEGLGDDLTTIEKSLERAEKLIEKALFYSRLEDQEHIDRGDRDLMQLVWEVADALEPLADERDIELAVEGPDLLICPAHPMLARAVENIVSNAIKWSPEASTVTVRLEGMPDAARIKVVDHGPGIPEEERQKLFTRFQRVDHAGVKGTGLGLAIAKRIVEMHEGRIWCEGTPGGGATFVLEVPRGQEVLRGQAADHVAPDLGELMG